MVKRAHTWWAATLCMLGLASAVAIAAPPIPLAKRKFDHARHAQSAAQAGKQAACAGCHRYDNRGVILPGKEHDRCIACHTRIEQNSSCTILKTPGVKGPARVCETCHTPKRAECRPPDMPPPPPAPSFRARFAHDKHVSFGAKIEGLCAQCHAAQATVKPTPAGMHAQCGSCHSAAGLAASSPMTSCETCHKAPATPAAQNDAGVPFRLVGFDHGKHHAKSPQGSCTGCHTRVVAAPDRSVLRPAMTTCQKSCHDGTKAFSTVGTRCSQCHTAKAGTTLAIEQRAVFQHAAHGARGVNVGNCGSCHALGADGSAMAPLSGKDHQPCAASGCHQDDFASRTPRTCGVCHAGVAVGEKVVARTRRVETPEWFGAIDHATHLAKLGTENAACESCHGEKLAGKPRPQGHAACAKCHAKGQAPAMDQCAACHGATRPQRAAASAWSVSFEFQRVVGHTRHAIDPRSKKPTACVACHSQIASAKSLATVAAPGKPACAACHDGKAAFKVTGFECARCHTKPDAAKPAGAGGEAPKPEPANPAPAKPGLIR